MKDPVSRRSRGFGFITYYDIESVDNALDHEPHTIDSKMVRKIFIGGLSYSTDDGNTCRSPNAQN